MTVASPPAERTCIAGDSLVILADGRLSTVLTLTACLSTAQLSRYLRVFRHPTPAVGAVDTLCDFPTTC